MGPNTESFTCLFGEKEEENNREDNKSPSQESWTTLRRGLGLGRKAQSPLLLPYVFRWSSCLGDSSSSGVSYITRGATRPELL